MKNCKISPNIEEIISENQRYIFNLAFRLCNNSEDADDLTQETFLRAIENYEKFRGEANIRTWLSKITINKFLDSKRRKRPHESTSLGIIPCSCNEPERIIIKKEMQECIHHVLLHHIPKKYKVVLVLREFYSYNYREIAEILQVSNATVKSRLHRARLGFYNHMVKSGCAGYVKDYTCYCEGIERL